MHTHITYLFAYNMHVRMRTAYKPSEFKYRTPAGPIVKNVGTYTFYDA